MCFAPLSANKPQVCGSGYPGTLKRDEGCVTRQMATRARGGSSNAPAMPDLEKATMGGISVAQNQHLTQLTTFDNRVGKAEPPTGFSTSYSCRHLVTIPGQSRVGSRLDLAMEWSVSPCSYSCCVQFPSRTVEGTSPASSPH
jgi:hypothetical protein